MDSNKPRKTKAKKMEDELWREYKEFEKMDSRYKEYVGQKAIPFNFQLGFETVSVEPVVLENIAMHWRQSNTTHKTYLKVQGIFFGQKTGSCVEVKESYQIYYTADGKILTDGQFYKSNFVFLGIYSSGNFPDQMDVWTLQNLCENHKHSVFLIKFNCGEEPNNISINVFENVYDLCKSNFETRIICMQAFSHHPQKSIINHQEHDVDMEFPKKVFYITFHFSLANHNRFERELSNEQKEKIKRGYEAFAIMPTYEEYVNTFSELVISEGLKKMNLSRNYGSIDYVQIAKEFCLKAKLELRFNFIFSLDDKSVLCESRVLNFGCAAIRPSLEESLSKAAADLLEAIRMKDWSSIGTKNMGHSSCTVENDATK